MNSYKFLNVKVTDEYISADVHLGNNYMMRVKDHILHIKYNRVHDVLFQAFQDFAIETLGDYDGEYEESSNKILRLKDYFNRS